MNRTAVAVAERRRKARTAAQGVVLLYVSGREQPVAGELMDWSPAGFRATHTCARLQAGDVVRFRDANHEGVARVIWTHIEDARIESGFWVMGGQLERRQSARRTPAR